VFENRVLRNIFGSKRDEVRKLHNEELHDLYSLPSKIRMIKLMRMRWAGHIVRMGRRRTHVGFLWENQRERDHYKDQDGDGWIILRWISAR
jgi:hypothetical protein